MHYKPAAIIFSLLSIATLCATAAPLLDIQKIAGKTEADVSKVLGKPDQQEKTKHGPKFSYKDGKIEVVFINGKADWITVSGMSSVPFDANAIGALGLKPEPPTFKNRFVIRWEPHATYNSVSFFPLDDKVDYAYIKVATK